MMQSEQDARRGRTARIVGLVGAGYIADAHLRALKEVPTAKAGVICDSRADKAESLSRAWGIPHWAGSVGQMLEEVKPDIVHIITPPTAHLAPALQCLAAGCAVFVEKPLAPSSEECLQLEEAARSAGVQAGVNHNQSWHPAVLRLEQLIREWKLGKVENITACLSTGLRQLNTGQHSHWMFRQPGNILLEQAPHPLSQIVRLIGPVRDAGCAASGMRLLNTGKPFYENWQISLACERGNAMLLLTFGRDDADNWIHVTGQDASAHADLRRNTVIFHPKTRWAPPLADCLDGVRNGLSLCGQGWRELQGYALGFLKLRAPQDTFSAGMRNSIGAFHAALSAGRPVPVPVRSGREIVETCELILARARQHGLPGEESARG